MFWDGHVPFCYLHSLLHFPSSLPTPFAFPGFAVICLPFFHTPACPLLFFICYTAFTLPSHLFTTFPTYHHMLVCSSLPLFTCLPLPLVTLHPLEFGSLCRPTLCPTPSACTLTYHHRLPSFAWVCLDYMPSSMPLPHHFPAFLPVVLTYYHLCHTTHPPAPFVSPVLPIPTPIYFPHAFLPTLCTYPVLPHSPTFFPTTPSSTHCPLPHLLFIAVPVLAHSFSSSIWDTTIPASPGLPYVWIDSHFSPHTLGRFGIVLVLLLPGFLATYLPHSACPSYPSVPSICLWEVLGGYCTFPCLLLVTSLCCYTFLPCVPLPHHLPSFLYPHSCPILLPHTPLISFYHLPTPCCVFTPTYDQVLPALLPFPHPSLTTLGSHTHIVCYTMPFSCNSQEHPYVILLLPPPSYLHRPSQGGDCVFCLALLPSVPTAPLTPPPPMPAPPPFPFLPCVYALCTS